MHYEDFDITGEEELRVHAKRHPWRVERLIQAVELFIEIGPAAGSRLYPPGLDQPDGEVSIHLTPPRAVLRGVPDMGGVLMVDRPARMIRLVEVIDEYGGDDEAPWRELVERARQWAAEQETKHVRTKR